MNNFLNIVGNPDNRQPGNPKGNFNTMLGVPTPDFGNIDDYMLDKNTGRLYKFNGNQWAFDYAFGAGGGGGGIAANVVLNTNNGAISQISWNTDIPSGYTQTYAQLFGSNPIIIEENKDDSGYWVPNGTPSYRWDSDNSILYFFPQTQYARFIFQAPSSGNSGTNTAYTSDTDYTTDTTYFPTN